MVKLVLVFGLWVDPCVISFVILKEGETALSFRLCIACLGSVPLALHLGLLWGLRMEVGSFRLLSSLSLEVGGSLTLIAVLMSELIAIIFVLGILFVKEMMSSI